MRRWLGAALLLALVVGGCSSSSEPAPDASSAPSPAARPTPLPPTPSLPVARAIASPSAVVGAQPTRVQQTFALQSTAFTDGGQLPGEYTCDGPGNSPPLAWTGAPPGTAAFALITQDADAKGDSGPFTEWLLYNMPKTITTLAPGLPARPLLPNGAQQGLNDKQTVGYVGACPDQGSGPHHIQFHLFAQDGYVTLQTGASYDVVHDALNGHTLGETQLIVTAQR